jgi:hypothetical protein
MAYLVLQPIPFPGPTIARARSLGMLDLGATSEVKHGRGEPYKIHSLRRKPAARQIVIVTKRFGP